MRKIKDLFGIKRTPQEAFKIGRILNRMFQFEKGYEEYHYRWCYKNLLFKGRKKHIEEFFERNNIVEKVYDKKIIYVGRVLVEMIEAKQSIVAKERVNQKIVGDTHHYQKDEEVDVTYPIVVYNKEEEVYYVWDGNSRINAAIILGEEDIKCRIIYP